MQEPVFLTISHNVFLNSDERDQLSAPGGQVETAGVCLPVWVRGKVTSEPAEEVVCRYRVVNDPGEPVGMADDGFTLRLSDPAWREELAGGGVYYSYQGAARSGEREVVIYNYVNIQDIGQLKGAHA